MLSSLSGPRRRFVLVSVGAAALLVVGGIVSAYLFSDQAADPVAQEELGPVLLVPGYGGRTAALDVLAGALREAGRDATVVQLAGDGTGDLAEQAGVVDAAVESALTRTGAETVDLVGYSAGGVTVRLWLDEFQTASAVRRVVTLGSPHHGTSLAALALDLAPDSCPIGCQQLATESDLLRALSAGDETPSGPTWVSIWSTDDRTVVPPDSASLDGALNLSVQSICPDAVVSHGNLPRTPTVMAMIIDVLGPGDPTLPTSALCATP
jgi:triacylglycerol lipase